MPSREKDRVRGLVCQAIAAEWTGPDPDADALRDALRDGLDSLWQRADRVSRDATTQTMARLLAEIISKQPNGTVPAGTDPADHAARQLARLLLTFLPREARSLAGLVASMGRPSPPGAPAPSPPASTSPDTVAPDDGEPSPAQTFERLLTHPGQLAAAWPSAKKMGELIKQILDRIKGLGCLGGLGDVVTWETYVIPRMATSYAVAAAVQQAFKTLALTGVVSSSASLGSTVHSRVSSSMATGMAPMLDRYLVADHAVYRLGIRSSFAQEAERTRLQGELSLTLLSSSRGESDPIGRVRARGTKTSRDDLVVFFGPTVSNLPGPFASGRPEVWEIKPIGELLTAVSQVSAYSLNYLAASVWARCKGTGGARIDNSIMLPGSPEAPAIPIPSISLTGIATATAGGAPATAAQITQLVAQFMKSSVTVGSVVAVPFVISGLYGVVPYFVLDLGKLKQLVEAALKLIIEALIAALMAYLAAKKLLEKLADVGLEVAKVLGMLLLLLVVAALAFLLAAALAPILAELAAVLVIAGVIALILRGSTSQGPGGGSQPSDPSATLLDIQLGPLSLQGISASRFADTVASLHRLYDAFWRDPGGGAAVA